MSASQCILLIFSINKVYTLYINVLGFVEEQGIAQTVSAQLSVHEVPSSIPWGQFTKTSTSVIYKCSYCFETLMATLAYYTCKSFIKYPLNGGGHPSHTKAQPFVGQRQFVHFSVVFRP